MVGVDRRRNGPGNRRTEELTEAGLNRAKMFDRTLRPDFAVRPCGVIARLDPVNGYYLILYLFNNDLLLLLLFWSGYQWRPRLSADLFGWTCTVTSAQLIGGGYPFRWPIRAAREKCIRW